MRAKLSDRDRIRIFSELQKKKIGLEFIAHEVGLSRRTISNWRSGKYTMPAEHFSALLSMTGIRKSELSSQIMTDWWNNSDAGRKSGYAVISKHGIPGTPESRRRGGQNSYLIRREVQGDIFARKNVLIPPLSRDLAELTGLIIGDGSVTKYQVFVYVNSVVDKEYGVYVRSLFEKLFGIKPSLSKKKNSNCLVITISSIALVEYLGTRGILKGNKIRQNLDIPSWVKTSPAYSAACIRGIFDTDGCIYQERHRIKGKVYCYPRIAFVSASPVLRRSIYLILEQFGLNPRIRNNRSVTIERPEYIREYFKQVGTSNPKHLKRYLGYGGVG